MSRLFNAGVIENIPVSKYFKIISLRPQSEIIDPEPGQFYMLQAGNTYDPLLKRPFSLFRKQDGILRFLYRIRGKGTKCLSETEVGDLLQLLGPLGNAYPVPEGDFVAVAGGIGIASLLPLLEQCPGRAYLFCGARNCDELVMLDQAKAFAKEICITTDDGTFCRKGLITEPLNEFLGAEKFIKGPLPIYACGPVPMIKELAGSIEGKDLTCYVSLEEVMACGVGACLGCVTKTAGGYKRVCREGPVFNIRDIVWE
ncbi:MAG TPA: dihydroorotate dehydrogenase electron transfer subunit [Dissulfurispiraceae bacterium]|nr:dihydroorotate dehydrogenase electron transfer subunit [Dissulfurispiraceae bacterium]